jgi:HAD superfamily hydrolase (TIGR01509 family)
MSATTCGASGRRSLDVAGLRAILFDVDGTLLDTRDAWIAAFDDGLAAVQSRAMRGTVGARWIGTPIETIYAERCGLTGDVLTAAVRAFQRSEADSLGRGVRAYPGVGEMLASLSRWPLATITNKRRDTTTEALRLAGLDDRFALILGGDSVPRKKPSPDPVLRAAEILKVPVGSCAVVGDTENDVRAGREAGAVTIGVTWGYGSRARLEEAGVGYLIETPAALPPLVRALTPSTGI